MSENTKNQKFDQSDTVTQDEKATVSLKLFEDCFSGGCRPSTSLTDASKQLPVITIDDGRTEKAQIDTTLPPSKVGLKPIEGSGSDRVILPVSRVEKPPDTCVTNETSTEPDFVAKKIINEQEIGKAAFEKIQNLLKDKKTEEAQKYVDQINKKLEENNSKFKLELTDEFVAYQVRINDDRSGEIAELRLVDKSKPKGTPDESPHWSLKATGDHRNSKKGDYPAYEKYEEPSKKTERLANEAAEDSAKKIIESKNLDSIKEKLENSGNPEDQIKRINEILKKSGSSLRLESSPLNKEGKVWDNSLSGQYKVDLRDGEKTIQSTTITDNHLRNMLRRGNETILFGN